MPKNVNDIIALAILILVIPGLWLAIGLGAVQMPGEIIGATIAAWTLVLQYYFRKSPPASPTGGATP